MKLRSGHILSSITPDPLKEIDFKRRLLTKRIKTAESKGDTLLAKIYRYALEWTNKRRFFTKEIQKAESKGHKALANVYRHALARISNK